MSGQINDWKRFTHGFAATANAVIDKLIKTESGLPVPGRTVRNSLRFQGRSEYRRASFRKSAEASLGPAPPLRFRSEWTPEQADQGSAQSDRNINWLMVIPPWFVLLISGRLKGTATDIFLLTSSSKLAKRHLSDQGDISANADRQSDARRHKPPEAQE